MIGFPPVNLFVLIHRAEEGGYWGEFPSLEGCFVQGETIDELLADAPAAAASHIEALNAEGQPLPPLNDVLIASIAVPAA
jgi:predicted RNase H-like HicB family nuclease